MGEGGREVGGEVLGSHSRKELFTSRREGEERGPRVRGGRVVWQPSWGSLRGGLLASWGADCGQLCWGPRPQ